MSFLATSYKSPQINSIQQLADSGDFKMVTINGIGVEYGGAPGLEPPPENF